jgi:hypothetical protein
MSSRSWGGEYGKADDRKIYIYIFFTDFPSPTITPIQGHVLPIKFHPKSTPAGFKNGEGGGGEQKRAADSKKLTFFGLFPHCPVWHRALPMKFHLKTASERRANATEAVREFHEI